MSGVWVCTGISGQKCLVLPRYFFAAAKRGERKVTSPSSVDTDTCWPHGCARTLLTPWLSFSVAHAHTVERSGDHFLQQQQQQQQALENSAAHIHIHTHMHAHTPAHVHTYIGKHNTHMQDTGSHVGDCLILTPVNVDAQRPHDSSWWDFIDNFHVGSITAARSCFW